MHGFPGFYGNNAHAPTVFTRPFFPPPPGNEARFIDFACRHLGIFSLIPRPSPSSVRNACVQFNAGVERRREKAWTNFTRDPRHRRQKCLTRNSVTYSVLALRVYVQLETTSLCISWLSGRRERGESRAGNSTGYSAELRD